MSSEHNQLNQILNGFSQVMLRAGYVKYQETFCRENMIMISIKKQTFIDMRNVHYIACLTRNQNVGATTRGIFAV